MNRVLQITGVVILSLATAVADPTTSAAIATAIGKAFLNGSALSGSVAVLNGDRLATGASAALVLHSSGSSIHIGPNSEAQYRGTTLELISGSAEVQGRESIVSGAYTFSPAIESRFTVHHKDSAAVLRLLHGNLKIFHATGVTVITAPGEYRFQDDAPAPPVKHRSFTKALPIAAGAAAGASVVIAHWLTGKAAASSSSCISGKSPTSCK